MLSGFVVLFPVNVLHAVFVMILNHRPEFINDPICSIRFRSIYSVCICFLVSSYLSALML